MSETSSRSSSHPARAMLRPRVVVAVALVVVTIVFVAQNRDTVSVQLLWATVSAPQWLLLTLTALVGGAVGALLRRRR